MAFLSRKKEEDALKSEQILLDATLMQNLQDRFCDANNLYLRCLDKNRTEVTKTYGSKEELEYLGSVIDMDRHIGLLERLLNSRIESVIEEDCGADGIRMWSGSKGKWRGVCDLDRDRRYGRCRLRCAGLYYADNTGTLL